MVGKSTSPRKLEGDVNAWDLVDLPGGSGVLLAPPRPARGAARLAGEGAIGGADRQLKDWNREVSDEGDRGDG